MELDQAVLRIRKLYAAATSATSEVNLTFFGGEGGVMGWKIRIGGTEASAMTHIDAAEKLIVKLTEDLVNKIKMTEIQADTYKKVLNEVGRN